MAEGCCKKGDLVVRLTVVQARRRFEWQSSSTRKRSGRFFHSTLRYLRAESHVKRAIPDGPRTLRRDFVEQGSAHLVHLPNQQREAVALIRCSQEHAPAT